MEKAHSNIYSYTLIFARKSKRLYIIVLELHIYQISVSYMQFLWRYSQNSITISKSRKSALKYPFLQFDFCQDK